jgi:hypothetical protein
LIILKINVKEINTMICLSLSYYGGFFILTPGINFRYFLPSYVLLLIAILYAFQQIYLRIFKRFKKHRKHLV